MNCNRIAQIVFATIIIKIIAGPYIAAGALVLLGVITLIKKLFKTY